MALTHGEQYTVFLLLLAERSSLRQAVEGTHKPDGSIISPPTIAANAPALQTQAAAAFQGLGVNPTGLNLAGLFDINGKNNVTTTAAAIAAAVALPYGGNCPSRPFESQILTGIKQYVP